MSTIKFTATPAVPPSSSTYIFGLEEPMLTEEQGIQIANQFGIRVGSELLHVGIRERALMAGRIEKNQYATTYKRGNLSLSVHAASGALRYRDHVRWGADIGKTVAYSDDEAIAKAHNYAIQMRLLPMKEFRVSRVKHLHIGTSDIAKNVQETKIVNAAVVFQRFIGRVPVEGSGGKLIVFLDADASVVGVDRVWRPITMERRAVTDFRDPEVIKNDFANQFSVESAAEVEVVESKFAYYEFGADQAQKHLQPVHLLYYSVKGPCSNTRSIQVIPASEDPAPGLELLAGEAITQAPRS